MLSGARQVVIHFTTVENNRTGLEKSPHSYDWRAPSSVTPESRYWS